MEIRLLFGDKMKFEMNLKEERESWETELEERLVVVDHGTVLVVLEGRHKHYYVHRYFTIGTKWEVSIDYNGDSLIEALKIVSNHFEDTLAELPQ